MSDDIHLIERLFQAAADLPAAQREPYLNEQGGDVGKNFAKELRAQVEILNKAEKNKGFTIAQKDVPLSKFGRTYMQVAQHNWEVDESAKE